MERHKKEKKHRKKVPRVPIKTYRWEDIRRARLKGGYPWTYLYKEPFNEDIDPKLFIMEPSSKSKSSSTLQTTSTEGVDIKEVTNGLEEHNIHLSPEPSSYIVITEVPSDSENHSKNAPRGSLTIEDVEEPETLNLESAESSDNISQYLDKEEPAPEPKPSETEEPGSSQNGRQERAKSEEPKKKRKLSIDSSYSRKSLSKLAIMKKLKEAKDKIKNTKLSLSSLPLPDKLKPESSKKSQEEPEKKWKPKDIMSYVEARQQNETPVYIHIPLKPPEGQTDEFSYLEFGDKKPEEAPKPQIPEIREEHVQNGSPPPRPSSFHEESQRKQSEHPDDIVAIEIVKTQTIDLPTESLSKSDMYLLHPGDGPSGDDIMVYLPGTEETEGLRRTASRLSMRVPSRQGSRKVRAKSAEPERKRKLSVGSSHSGRSVSKEGLMKKLKNAKEKLMKVPSFSLSRSNSKKEEASKKNKEEASKKNKEEPSLPKETKQETKKEVAGQPKYIHIPLKPPPGQTDEFSYLEFEEKEEKKEEEKPKPEVSEQEEQSSIESPTVKPEGVQFIVLTPPSDDEILDQPDVPETPSVDNKQFFEGRIHELKEIAKDAVEEVSPKSKRKQLEAVGEENGSDKTKKTEESEKKDVKETEQKKEEATEKTEKMVVDEEDGLKLTESAMAKQEQNIKAKEVEEPAQDLKSSLKADAEASPVLKKKVSFKRKSKDDSKDGIYEDVQPPTDGKITKGKATEEQKGTLADMGNSQSMSTEEEKSYLDEKKIIKTTSLEEDYNRWSKLSDHEYEPVNPPPDDHVVGSKHTSPLPSEPAHIDTSQAPQPISQASSTTSLERRMLGGEPAHPEPSTIQEMQTQIETTYFTKATEQAKPQKTVHIAKTTTRSETSSDSKKKSTEAPNKLQQAIKVQTGKLRTKLHEIKKPNIKLPSKPKLSKPKFKKPNIHLPKMPDSLPSFSLPRKKRSLKERQLSTESNAGDSKSGYFDFSTYPRLFRKKKKNDLDSSFGSEREVPAFATVPRTKRNKEENDRWGGRDTIRIPLHSEDSMEEREDSVERRMASHMRFDRDIDIDDAYERENQEIHTASPFSHDYNSRWNHGSFHPQPARNQQVTDLDSPEDVQPHDSFDTNNSKDVHSSESSLGVHRRGVLEEIDSDEFFLRQKGISQDNIEVGMYLSSEIREAFKSPNNALADLQRDPREYEARAASNQSLPETPPKRKVMKKPKRKKTPHVSQEQISFDQDSEQEFAPPARPKRRSKRNKKPKEEHVIPYQETIAVEPPEENLGILKTADEPEEFMYENEQMEGKEQPEIKVTDPYSEFKYEEESDEEAPPEAPPRKQRSLKSLNYSEHDSIMGELNLDKEPPLQDIEVYRTEHEYIIPTPELPPTKPPRTLSRSSSKSRDNEEPAQEETPVRPVRSQSRTRSRAESLTNEEPCVEETCVQDFRDCMGYAVIDKNTKREPPLPPPRTPPRRKRTIQESKRTERKFFTVPRPLNDEPPLRPTRNYSTLGPSRPPRRRPTVNMTDEEKENIDITQYIEIEDEPNRDLHSGEVIQKMRDRPLPAPPRPPRKTRALQDITSQENIAMGSEELDKNEVFEEAEVSTQTEPLPDFESESPIQLETEPSTQPQTEPSVQPQIEASIQLQTETSICPQTEPSIQPQTETSIQPQTEPSIQPQTEPSTQPQTEPSVTVERRLITPTRYSYEEETITHGSLVVQPLNGAKILPDSELTRVERSVPITKDYEDETSEIPEEFTKLKDPPPPQPPVVERVIERPVLVQPDEVEVLRAQKLQVSDLDVDRLSVNELTANKIIVSEIESGSIQTNEISSKTGALKVGEIELPPGVVQQLFEKLQSVVQSGPKEPTPEPSPKDESEDAGQKKTPFEEVTLPQRPPRKVDETRDFPVTQTDRIEETETVDIGQRQTDSLNAIEILEIEEIQETIQETIIPPEPPVRSDSAVDQEVPKEPAEEKPEQAPQRPPRHAEKTKSEEPEDIEQAKKPEEIEEEPLSRRIVEPEVDEEPPPRPPEPQVAYIPSQPPPSFYALRAQQYVDEGDIPMAPRRRRHPKPPVSRSSSDDSPAPPPSRKRYRSPEPTIPQLTGQLIQACGSAANSSIKRLIAHITNNLLRNADGQQDMHVIIVILLVLIAGLILLGYGDGKTVHYHHWEYFNPPRDM